MGLVKEAFKEKEKIFLAQNVGRNTNDQEKINKL